MLQLISYNEKFERVVIKEVDYKRDATVEKHLIGECDKFFGVNGWLKVADYSNSLDNVTGWYATDNSGITLGYETKPL